MNFSVGFSVFLSFLGQPICLIHLPRMKPELPPVAGPIKQFSAFDVLCIVLMKTLGSQNKKDSVDGSEIPFPTTWDGAKTLVNSR